MRVCFLAPPPCAGAPPAERIFGCNHGIYPQPNVFVLQTATVAARAGHEVRVRDFPLEGLAGRDFDRFSREQRFDAIVFWTVFLSRQADLQARSTLARHAARTRFVFTGTEPTAHPELFVDPVSVVIRGEPEERLVAVLEALAAGALPGEVPGVSFLSPGGIVHRPGPCLIDDLDRLPPPDRSLLPQGPYHNPKLAELPFTTMLASRGCTHGCSYCVPNSLAFAREIEARRHDEKKPPVRLRSVAAVVSEFTELARSGFRSISFVDDQFVWGSGRTRELCEGFAGTGVEWSCLARSDSLLDREMVLAMGRSGCRYVDIGIESFTQEILDDVGKGLSVETVYDAVSNLRAAGIEPELNVMIGASPLETPATIERSFQEVVRLDVDYVLFSVCTPFPCTAFASRALREGWMIEPEYRAIDPMRESFVSYPHLPKEELDRTVRSLYRRFYFRPAYLWRRLSRVRSLRDLVNKLRAALSILRW